MDWGLARRQFRAAMGPRSGWGLMLLLVIPILCLTLPRFGAVPAAQSTYFRRSHGP